MTRVRLDTLLLVVALGALLILGASVPLLGAWGTDAAAYWSIRPDPYGIAVGHTGAFLYGPPFALVSMLLGQLPWPVFLAGFTVVTVAALVVMAPGRAALLFLLPPVALEVYYGNIHLLLALAIVAGFRWPGAWAFVLLSKVAPGVGLAWFVARRDWRSLGIALGATAAVAVVSFVIAPDLWLGWIGRLSQDARGASGTWLGALLGPLWLRIALGAAVAFLGGLAGYRWTVAVAATLAIPSLWIISPSLLVALVPLVAMDRRDPLPAMLSLSRHPRTARCPAPRSAPARSAPPA